MEGVISISTATATPTSTVNGHHYHSHSSDEKKCTVVDDNHRGQPSPTLGKNGQQDNKKAPFSDTAANNNSNLKNGGKHSGQDIRIHSPSPSPSPCKSKNTNEHTTTRFNLDHGERDESEDQHDDDHGQDDHESHLSGMDLDCHEHDHHHHHDDDSHHLSEDKYTSLKRKLKLALEDNERMSHELDKFHRRVRHLRREKNLILDRLCTLQRQGGGSGSDSVSSLSSDSESSDSSLSDESHRPAQQTGGSKQGPGSVKGNGNKGGRGSGPNHAAANTFHSVATTSTGEAVSSTQHQKKKGVRRSSPSAPGTLTSISARPGPKESKSHTPAAVPSTITNVGSATQKPKRVHQTNKQRPGLAKARKVQIVEKDEQGNVKLPVTVGIITILSIGHVVYDREAFHNDRYIWPVGYKMSRSYNSMIDPTTHTTYTCSVIDDGEAPKFQIDAEDQPGKPIIAGTATGAWTHIVKAANAIRKRDHSNSASGPDYFGFSNATIAKMIQDLPNAEKCSTYVMQQFEEIAGSGGSALAGGAGSGTAGQTPGGGGVTGKRKVSALASGAKSGKDQNGDEHDAADGETGAAGRNDDDDDEEYASLGSLSKPSDPKSVNVATNTKQKKTKKTKLSATTVAMPAIRLAGINEFALVSSNSPLPPSTTGSLSVKEINDVQDGGEEVVSESGSPQAAKLQRQSNGASTEKAAATAELADQDVDVDVVDFDDDERQERPHRTQSPVGANGSEARRDDEGMTTDEDVPLHKV
ncbi:hypothetical protein EC957_008454 [Mortierella hygrophila]|uniref:FYR N-terminal domain-containing protein n=1 Tax=Mortierella hygrophila TaxID=979708 RepID=A0A9P6FC65_9FUNG|nr:hypothetical protein EC957_008454 [Mortierella hygrophila]